MSAMPGKALEEALNSRLSGSLSGLLFRCCVLRSAGSAEQYQAASRSRLLQSKQLMQQPCAIENRVMQIRKDQLESMMYLKFYASNVCHDISRRQLQISNMKLFLPQKNRLIRIEVKHSKTSLLSYCFVDA